MRLARGVLTWRCWSRWRSLAASVNGHWSLSARCALLLVGLVAAAVRLQSGASWASVAAMVSLQFAGGAMNLPWMLAVTACMAVLTVGEILLAELMLPGAISPIARPTA